MTAGHRHPTIPLRRDSRLFRLLSVPVVTTDDHDRAERSPYVYRLGSDAAYQLTLLGVLHRLIGLTVDIRDRPR